MHSIFANVVYALQLYHLESKHHQHQIDSCNLALDLLHTLD